VKRLIFVTIIIFLFISFGVIYSPSKTLYQMVDTYVCEEELGMAELTAKAQVNRKELLTVSYCTCEGVAVGRWSGKADLKCDPPKDIVYACSCIGKNHY